MLEDLPTAQLAAYVKKWNGHLDRYFASRMGAAGKAGHEGDGSIRMGRKLFSIVSLKFVSLEFHSSTTLIRLLGNRAVKWSCVRSLRPALGLFALVSCADAQRPFLEQADGQIVIDGADAYSREGCFQSVTIGIDYNGNNVVIYRTDQKYSECNRKIYIKMPAVDGKSSKKYNHYAIVKFDRTPVGKAYVIEEAAK